MTKSICAAASLVFLASGARAAEPVDRLEVRSPRTGATVPKPQADVLSRGARQPADDQSNAKGPLAEPSLFLLAQRADHSFDLDTAIDRYESLVRKFPRSKDAPVALVTAARRLEARQRYKAASEAYLKYATLYPEQADAPDVTYLAATMHQRMHDSPGLIDGLQRYVSRFKGREDQHERVVAAELEIGKAESELGRVGKARKAYAQTISFWNEFGMTKDNSMAAQAASEAAFNLAEDHLITFQKINFAPMARRAMLRTNSADLEKIVEVLRNLISEYDDIIVKYQQPEWMSAAMYRDGFADELFAQKVAHTPCPPELEKQRQGACDRFHSTLEEQTRPMRERAAMEYQIAADGTGHPQTVSKWKKLAREKVCQNTPADCRSMKDPRPQFISVSLSPLPLTSQLNDSAVAQQGLPVTAPAPPGASPRPSLSPAGGDGLEAVPDGVYTEFAGALTAAEAGKVDDATALYQRVIADWPQASAAHYNLGVLYERRDQRDKAVSEYEQALNLKGDFEAASENLSRIYLRSGDTAQAESGLRARVLRYPSKLAFRNQFVRVMIDGGRLADAESDSKKILRVDERNVDALLNLASVSYAQKRYELAEQVLEAARDILDDPQGQGAATQRDAYAPAVWNLLALTERGLDQRAIAFESVRKAVALMPEYPEAHNNYGAMLNEVYDCAGAITELELAVRYAPDYPEIHLNLGNAYRCARRNHDAESEYEKARAQRGSPDSLFNSALLYLDGFDMHIAYNRASPLDSEALQRLRTAVMYFDAYQEAGGDDSRFNAYYAEAKQGVASEERRTAAAPRP